MAILVVSFALVSRCPFCGPNITNRVVFVAAVQWHNKKRTHIDYRTIMNMTQNGQNMKKKGDKTFWLPFDTWITDIDN